MNKKGGGGGGGVVDLRDKVAEVCMQEVREEEARFSRWQGA